jgi:CubicO group peptidase (beta-lactamase class C family)
MPGGLDRRSFLLTVASAFAPLPAAASPVGWSEAGLARFRRQARDLGVLGLVVVSGGETIVSDGEVARPSRIASIRKSVLSALYGMIDPAPDLDQTIGALGIDDNIPLTALEKAATVRQLLQARSGIYIPSAAESAAMKAARPARGSHPPGTFWYYNNWDFNALGEIYQRLTGRSVFTAVEHLIAGPLGFQDFDPLRDLRFGYDPDAPRFGAYNMWMSTRDLARFGQLYLDRGAWRGRRLVAESWIDESTRAYSRTDRAGLMSGYGYLWWVTTRLDGADPAGIPVGTFLAVGNGGRYVVVLPSLGTVVAIQPDEQPGRPPVPLYADKGALDRLITTLIAARKA